MQERGRHNGAFQNGARDLPWGERATPSYGNDAGHDSMSHPLDAPCPKLVPISLYGDPGAGRWPGPNGETPLRAPPLRDIFFRTSSRIVRLEPACRRLELIRRPP